MPLLQAACCDISRMQCQGQLLALQQLSPAQWEPRNSRGSPVSAPGIVHTWLSPLNACLHMACSPALALLCKRPVFAKPPILNPALAPSSSPFLSQVQHSWGRASTGSNPASLLLTASREGSNPRKESGKVFSFSAGNLTSRLLLFHCVSLSSTHCKHE